LTKAEKSLRLCHTVATAQFAASAVLVIAWSLAASGLNWIALFSLSAQGVVLTGLAVFIYGFAVFRGAVGERIEAEHPLTSSMPYRVFYLVLPVAGGILVGADGLLRVNATEGIRAAALGTVVTAFVTWLFLDPFAGIVESALPESRRARSGRSAAVRAAREKRRLARERKMDELLRRHRRRGEEAASTVKRRAVEIADALVESSGHVELARAKTTTLAFETWREGGAESLSALRARVAALCDERGASRLAACLDYWWDGLGGLGREKFAPAGRPQT
jgi:hypothetical protein